MGCFNEKVIEKKKPKFSSKSPTRQSLINQNPSNIIKSQPQISQSIQNNNTVESSHNNHHQFLKFRSPRYDQDNDYSLRSFNTIEKISDNFVYKAFRMSNQHSLINQKMYVIPLAHKIDTELVNNLLQYKDTSLIMVNFFFTDANFNYIITDYAPINIFEAVYHYGAFSYSKLRPVIRNCLRGINFIYQQNGSIPKFTFDKVKVLNDQFDIKIEHFDLKYILDDYIYVKNPIENVLFELGKMIVVLVNNYKEIPSKEYKDIDISLYYSREKISEIVNSELCDLLEILLLSETKDIDTILQMPYFSNDLRSSAISKMTHINTNDVFYTFYSKLLLFKETKTFLKYDKICKENNMIYESLFEDLDKEASNDIKISQIAMNLRKNFQDQYTQHELNEIIILFTNMKMSFFSKEQAMKILAGYDCMLNKNMIKKAFEFFDRKHVGKISVDVLKEIFDLSGKIIEELSDIVKEVVRNDEKMISFNELFYILVNIN